MLSGGSLLSMIYRFFRSLKLAVVLILYLVVVSVLATLVVQHRDPSFYHSNYGSLLGWLIVSTGFDNFFNSLLFLVPTALFFVNLSVCTYHRLWKRVRKGLKKRFGPDILHVGLMLLMIGGVVIATNRQVGHVNMRVGDEVALPGGYVIRLERFETLTYEDGRPRDWISTVAVIKDGTVIEDSFPIEVNNPLRIGGIKVYQASFGSDRGLILSDPGGQAYRVDEGQSIPADEESYLFVGIEPLDDGGTEFAGIFDVTRDEIATGTVEIRAGDKIGDYLIEEIFVRGTTGLRIAQGSGRILVLVSLLLIMTGLSLTYIQKIGDRQL